MAADFILLYTFILLLVCGIILIVPVCSQWYGSQSNYISYKGIYYSLLSNHLVDGFDSYCQDNCTELPENWAVAPDNADSIAVISAHYWSTNVVVVANGKGYWGLRETPGFAPGELLGEDMLFTDGTMYAPIDCNFKVMRGK